MSRWIAVLSLVLGFALLCASPRWATPAFAQFGESIDATTTDETTPAATTAEEAPAKPFPTKALIRDFLEQGKASEAEQGYLEWASYWQDDDPDLLVPTMRNVLMADFRAGKNGSLIALAQAGDKEALNILTAQVLSSSEQWPPSDLIPAIRFIGRSGDRDAFNVLRTMLYNDDASVVNAAIEALGHLGDARIAGDLTKMFEDADSERSVVLARALTRLGKAKQVRARFEPQLQFPLPGVAERAALVLAATGQQKGWPLLNRMMQAKQAPYYPLVVTVLGALPSQESQAYVTAALGGQEPEQLAALQSIQILPAEKQDALLLAIMRDDQRPASVRVQAIRMIGERRIDRAAKELRVLATKLTGDDAAVKAEAMMSLYAFDQMREFNVREVVRQRVQGDEAEVVRAARAVLLQYGLNAE